MIVIGSLVVLGIFLAVGWAVSTEMFQQRTWRRRVEEGDLELAAALVEEAIAGWRKARAPEGVGAPLWAAVQGAQLVSVGPGSATVSASAEAEFRSDGARRVQVAGVLESAVALAARLVDMVLYDVPNLRLEHVRVDIYSTFTADDGGSVQRPILTTSAGRSEADVVAWEAMTPEEILARFDTRYEVGAGGAALPIDLPPDTPLSEAPAGDVRDA